MSKPRKFRLRKDLPDCPAGTIFYFGNSVEGYFGEYGEVYPNYRSEIVENSPDWFEEITEKTVEEELDYYYHQSVPDPDMRRCTIGNLLRYIKAKGLKIVKESEAHITKEMIEEYLKYHWFTILDKKKRESIASGIIAIIDEPTQAKPDEVEELAEKFNDLFENFHGYKSFNFLSNGYKERERIRAKFILQHFTQNERIEKAIFDKLSEFELMYPEPNPYKGQSTPATVASEIMQKLKE